MGNNMLARLTPPNPHNHKHHLGFVFLGGKLGGKKRNEPKKERKCCLVDKVELRREK